ncbi:MAG: anti-sigma factor family protein, partial [Ktedonobacterales bacterium]
MNNHTQPFDQLAPACAALAPLLPLLDDETLAPADAARVREHLTYCSACQAQRAAYSRLTIGLRRHFGPTAFAPLRLEDIMEKLPSSNTDTSPALLDIAPLPSAPRQPAPRAPHRIRSGVASLAAVLVVALLATYIFANRPHPKLPASEHGTPGVTVSQTSTQTGFSGVSMVSPDEGWMVGSTSTTTYTIPTGPSSSVPTPPPSAATATAAVVGSSSSTVLTGAGSGTGSGTGAALLYHYKHGSWTPYT